MPTLIAGTVLAATGELLELAEWRGALVVRVDGGPWLEVWVDRSTAERALPGLSDPWTAAEVLRPGCPVERRCRWTNLAAVA